MTNQNAITSPRATGEPIKPWRRLISLLLSFALFTLLTACGPRTPLDTPNIQAASSTASPDSRPLRMLWYGNAAEEALLRQQLADANLNVELQVVPMTQLAETINELTTSGKTPDVVRTFDPASNLAALQPVPDVEVDDYLVGLDWAMLRAKDVVAVPYTAKTSITWINADLFAAGQVTLPTTQSPWKSWDRMLADAARAVATAEHQPSQPLAALDESTPLPIDAYLWQHGLSFYDHKRAGSAWRVEAGARTLTELRTGVERHQLADTFSLDETQNPAKPAKSAQRLFEAGELPILLTDSNYRPTTTFNAVALPDPCQERCGPVPAADYLVNLSGRPAANQLITSLSTPAAQAQRAEIGQLPTRRQVLAELSQWPAERGDAITKLAAAELVLVPPTALASGFSPARPAVDQATSAALADFIAGSMTAQQASDVIGKATVRALQRGQ